MSDVKRECIQIGSSAAMYVLASDYDALAAELAEAKRDWEELDARLPAIEDWEKTVAERDALRAALERIVKAHRAGIIQGSGSTGYVDAIMAAGELIDGPAVQPTAGQREVETFTGTCRNCGMPALDHDWTFRGLRCPTVQAPSRGPLKVCRRSSSNLTGGTPCDCATPADCTMMRATSQTTSQRTEGKP